MLRLVVIVALGPGVDGAFVESAGRTAAPAAAEMLAPVMDLLAGPFRATVVSRPA
jgi:hypothetical protein